MIKINLLKEKFKVCLKCEEEKTISNFTKRKSEKDGFNYYCKNCEKEYKKEYKLKLLNGEKKILREMKICRICNENKNIEEFVRNKHSIDGYASECKKCWKEIQKSWRENNKEYIKKYHKEYSKKENNIQKRKERLKEKYNKDVKFKLHHCFSSQLRDCLNNKGIVKDRKCFEIVGYNLEELQNHLEKKFDDKMNWENYGSYWHIDHIKPKASFSFNSYEDEEFKKCWSLENLRPLEKIENLRKGDREEKGE